MNAFDLVILVLAVSAGLGGWRLGFLARALSWVGLGVGLVMASQLLPTAVRQFEGPDPTSRLLIAGAVLLAGAFLGQALGLLLGSRIHGILPPGGLRTVDRSAGAGFGVLGVLVSMWLILPSMARVEGLPSQLARESRVARLVDDLAPDAPDRLQALGRILGDTAFPEVFADLKPSEDVGPPPADSGLPPEVVARVLASTVKVEGEACNRLQEGSGFAAAPDTIVTNAHVVAGEKKTTVIRPDGKRLEATIVVFDKDRDLAVLKVRNLGQNPLAIGDSKTGSNGAVFGHPGGQDEVRVAPAALRQRVQAVGRDLYDQGETRRDVWILASALRPGDSGGALVDSGGVVVGVAFAIAPDREGTAYALTTKELDPVLDASRGATKADPGPCLT